MRPFGDRGVVGEVRFPQLMSLLVGGKDWPERKTLWRLRCMKPAAGNGFADHASGRIALQRIGDGQRGSAPSRSPMAAIVRSMRSASTNGRTASWIKTALARGFSAPAARAGPTPAFVSCQRRR